MFGSSLVSHGTLTGCIWFELPLFCFTLDPPHPRRYCLDANLLLHLRVPLWIPQLLVYSKLHSWSSLWSSFHRHWGLGVGALGDQIQPQVSCLELVGRRGQPRDWKMFLKIRLSPEIARGTRAPLERERPAIIRRSGNP